MIAIEETARVLARINDGRPVDEFTIADWHQVLTTDPRLTLDEALAAVVTHKATSTEFIKPAHVLAQVRTARRARGIHATDEEICAKWGPKFAAGVCSICGIHEDTHPTDPTAA